jgi:hypothetical protein
VYPGVLRRVKIVKLSNITEFLIGTTSSGISTEFGQSEDSHLGFLIASERYNISPGTLGEQLWYDFLLVCSGSDVKI